MKDVEYPAFGNLERGGDRKELRSIASQSIPVCENRETTKERRKWKTEKDSIRARAVMLIRGRGYRSTYWVFVLRHFDVTMSRCRNILPLQVS